MCVHDDWLNAVKFNTDGLVPAIAQDWQSGKILMMAWMNAEALALTAKIKTAVYFSRSRQKLWHKGETSGHTQKVHEIRLDCDADVIVLLVTQVGGIACHTGRESCFFQKLDCSSETPIWQTVDEVIKNPEEIYGQSQDASKTAQSAENQASVGQKIHDESSTHALNLVTVNELFSALDEMLEQRKTANKESSYVASLYHKGINKILEKVGEEATEAIIAAKDLSQYSKEQRQAFALKPFDTKNKTPEYELIYEVADIWFHTLVTLAWFNIGSDKILSELARRFGLSGLDEKASRGQ